ncbi:uncharacterized protein LOC106640504, partial [Copidosoma floridanum]|uniref:uncharacterized protein LOC106640504 n=1 Tax=Copidosoma floridanum TaxID=29053 RepID=UPI000C6F6DA8
MEIVLERIGPKKDIIVVNKEIFSCGRMKDNDIICLSLLVSRKHCTFSRFPTTLYVSDLGSSNGVYINGVKIEEKKSIPLNDNDIVGIGCNEIKNLDDSMYVFRVKKKVTNLSSSNNCLESDRQSLKEQSKARKSDLNSVPSKIVKCSDHRVQISCTNEDDCIEIIECTSTSNTEGGQSIPKSKTNDVNFCTSNVVSTKQEISEVIPDVIELSDSEDVKCKINVECLNNGTCTKNIEIKSTKISEYESVSLTNDIPNTAISIPSNHEHANNQEQLNDANHDIVSVKEEPDWSHFSQIDVVEIDNDHDNNVSIFTYSQNFEQAANIKVECENEDDQLQSSLFFDDEDDNIITILDSDEDNIGAENNQVDYSQLIPPIKIEPELRVEIRADSQKSVDTFQVDEHLAQPNLRVEVSASSKPCVTYVEASTLGIHEQSESVIINTVKISNVPEKQKTFSPVNNKDVEEHVLSSISKRPKPSEQESEKSSLKDKVQKKIGIEIVEPHHLKTSRRSRNSEKDSRSRSKSRHEFRQRKSHSKLTKHKDTTRSSKKKGKNREFDNDKDMNKELNFKNLKSNKKNSAHEDLNSNNTSKELFNMSNENSIGNTSNSKLQNQSRPKYRTTKVKVKVSQKSRGDMLCDSMLTLRPEQKKNKNLDEAPIKPPLTRLDPVFVIPRRQMPSSTNYNNINVGVVSSTDSIPDRLNSPPPLNSSTDTLAVIPNIVNHAEDSPPRNNSPSPSTIEPMYTDAPFKDQNLKPSLTIPSLLNNRRKTVSFNDTPAVKEFQIIDGNKLRNIKDGLSLRSTKKDFVYYKQMELKIEDFLARVFVWEPIWLQQQNEVKSLPPIVKHNDKQPLPLVFNSFQQYYKRMEVLLLLETWQQLLKEFQCTGIREKQSEIQEFWNTVVDKHLLDLPNKTEQFAVAMSSATERIPKFVSTTSMTNALNSLSTKIDNLTRATDSINNAQRTFKNSKVPPFMPLLLITRDFREVLIYMKVLQTIILIQLLALTLIMTTVIKDLKTSDRLDIIENDNLKEKYTLAEIESKKNSVREMDPREILNKLKSFRMAKANITVSSVRANLYRHKITSKEKVNDFIDKFDNAVREYKNSDGMVLLAKEEKKLAFYQVVADRFSELRTTNTVEAGKQTDSLAQQESFHFYALSKLEPDRSVERNSTEINLKDAKANLAVGIQRSIDRTDSTIKCYRCNKFGHRMNSGLLRTTYISEMYEKSNWLIELGVDNSQDNIQKKNHNKYQCLAQIVSLNDSIAQHQTYIIDIYDRQIQTLMLDSGLPVSMWSLATEVAIRLQNRTLHYSIDLETSVSKDQKSHLDTIKRFICLAYAKIPIPQNKFSEKTLKAIL